MRNQSKKLLKVTSPDVAALQDNTPHHAGGSVSVGHMWIAINKSEDAAKDGTSHRKPGQISPNTERLRKEVDGESERATQSQVKDLNCTTAALCSLSTILISPAPFDLPQTCITMTTPRILGSGKQAALPTAPTVSVLRSLSLHAALL